MDTPPPPPPHSVINVIQSKLTPGVLLIIAILAVVFFIFGLLNLLVQNILRLRRARRRRRRVGVGEDGSPTTFQGQLQQLFHLHDAGVDQACIDALPVFVYRAVVVGAGAGSRKDGDPFDCAVCLCEFDMDDKLRLLPTCGHAFHVPCIDAWLLSHSTCPLCRGSILAAELSPASSPAALALESESLPETARDADGRDGEGSPIAEEVVEVKLGKLRCVDGNGSAGELAVDGASSRNGGGGGRGNLAQRRCLSMGSYEYVMDNNAALHVAIKTPKRTPATASSRSRRRLALSDCDLGSANKGAWETAVTEAASADAGRCGDSAAAARLNKDSFSVSKIWMVPSTKEHGRTAEFAAGRRAVSFRWPAASKKHTGGSEEHGDVEVGIGGNNGASSLAAEERPPSARTTLLLVVSGRQQSGRAGSHS